VITGLILATFTTELNDIGSLYRKVAIETLSYNVLLEIFDLCLGENERLVRDTMRVHGMR
jgi:hypothetical protein